MMRFIMLKLKHFRLDHMNGLETVQDEMSKLVKERSI